MQPPTFENVVGAALALGSLLVVAYLAIAGGADAQKIALGALIGVVSAATGFFLRAKVQTPTSQPPPAILRSANLEQTQKRE